jgi:hypothetical protein
VIDVFVYSGGGTGSGTNSVNHSRQSSFQTDTTDQQKKLDPHTLLKMAPNVVKTRKGSVLARNTILKMDHFSSGKYTD